MAGLCLPRAGRQVAASQTSAIVLATKQARLATPA
jgi:hypothetical protein